MSSLKPLLKVARQDEGKRNLCICTSPLQAFLLLAIIRSCNIDAAILYFAPVRSERNTHYFNALKQFSSSVSLVYVGDKPVWSALLSLELILLGLKRVDTIYVASFNSFYPAYVVNRLRVPNLYLFDDGSFSLLDNITRAAFYHSLPTSRAARAVLKVLRINKFNNELLLEAKRLYTVFPCHQQLVSSGLVVPIPIDMAELGTIIACPLCKTLNIFIGDVPQELTKDQLILYERIVNNDYIHYLVPHPRDDGKSVGRAKSITIQTVAEEFIVKMLMSGHHVNILSLSSTTLFTVPKLPHLNKYIIRHPQCPLPCLMNIAEDYNIAIADECDLPGLLGNC